MNRADATLTALIVTFFVASALVLVATSAIVSLHQEIDGMTAQIDQIIQRNRK